MRVRRISRWFIFRPASGFPFFFLFISLFRIVRFDPAFHAPRDASVTNALGALGPCHALRLSSMTAFRTNAIASITVAGLSV